MYSVHVQVMSCQKVMSCQRKENKIRCVQEPLVKEVYVSGEAHSSRGVPEMWRGSQIEQGMSLGD